VACVTIELDSVTNMLIYPDKNSCDVYTFLAVTVCHVLIVAAMTLPVAASAVITEIGSVPFRPIPFRPILFRPIPSPNHNP